MKKILLMVLIASVALTSVFAMGAEEKSTEPVSEFKDTLVIATGSDQNYMDGQMNNTNDVFLRAVYSQLVRRGLDGEIEGDLAESWSVAEDGVTWTFNLRHGVKFHNGKELTSKDVVASYNRLLTNSGVRYSSLANGYIAEVVAVDDYTVNIVTKEQIACLLANLTHRSNLILDADYIEKYGMDLGLSAESVNGTGPYKLTYWDRDQEMKLEANPDYFRGEVKTKYVDIQIVKDKNARLVAVETAQVDLTTGLDTNEIPRLSGTKGLNVLMLPGIGSQGLQFNCSEEHMKDPKVRQAVSYAIDRQLIIDTLYASIGEKVCTSPVNPNVWGYNDFGVIGQDQAKAKQLLAEAGYPNGFKMSIMLYPGYNKSTEACEMIVAMLDEVGIKASIEVVDNAGFNSAMGNRTYPGENFPWALFFMGYGAGTADCDEGLRRIWTTSPDGNNNNNYGWYSNARVDELLAAAKAELDATKRLGLYKEAEEILFIEDPAAIFLNDRFNIWVSTDKVDGFAINANNAIFWDNITVRN
jgi:ABC-type dipeptide transport system, periplasmic component